VKRAVTPPKGRARPVRAGLPFGAPQRKKLPHDIPSWIRPEDEIFFITICCNKRGTNQLCRPSTAKTIFDSISFRNQHAIWYAHLVVLMPDHLHALISFPQDQSMKRVISDWKRFLATKLNLHWQRDFFDHRLRGSEGFAEKAAYIHNNPVRAGYITSSDEWRYCWRPKAAARPAVAPYHRCPRGVPGGRALPLLLVASLLAVSCRPDMNNQPKAKPLSQSEFFANGTSARQPPVHTVADGDVRENAAFYTGLTNGTYITQLPMKLTPELLARGGERFDAVCAECHDRTGSGNGMVVQRGFPQPPSLHVDRLRNAPIGHFYDVITNGYGVMYSYATRVDPEDRWAIATYIRALQFSHNAKLSDVDPAERPKLEGAR
jgi:REP element-mobilizing transposase RayT/mono/diheme cytochrome c family protein